MKEDGTGSYLLLIDYGMEGWVVKRYPTEHELVEAIQSGESHGNRIIAAEERTLLLGFAEEAE